LNPRAPSNIMILLSAEKAAIGRPLSSHWDAP
jgi:hypothetical protein